MYSAGCRVQSRAWGGSTLERLMLWWRAWRRVLFEHGCPRGRDLIRHFGPGAAPRNSLGAECCYRRRCDIGLPLALGMFALVRFAHLTLARGQGEGCGNHQGESPEYDGNATPMDRANRPCDFRSADIGLRTGKCLFACREGRVRSRAVRCLAFGCRAKRFRKLLGRSESLLRSPRERSVEEKVERSRNARFELTGLRQR